MSEQKNHSAVRVVVSGVAIMASLYGYLAYAADGLIERDLKNINTQIQADKNNIPDDQIASWANVKNDVVSNQVNGVLFDFFGVRPGPASTGTPITDPATYAIGNHFFNYCAGGGFESGNCPKDPLLQYGDVNFSVVISGTNYEPVEQTAAQDFMNNFFNSPANPLVTSFADNTAYPKPLTSDFFTGANADPAKKAAYAAALSDEAFLSVIRESFSEMIAKRTPIDKNIPSQMAKMEQEAIQRYFSPTWLKALTTAGPDYVQQQMAIMQSYQMWMDYQRYRQMERVEALLGAMTLYLYRANKASQQQLQTGTSGKGTSQSDVEKSIPGGGTSSSSGAGQ